MPFLLNNLERQIDPKSSLNALVPLLKVRLAGPKIAEVRPREDCGELSAEVLEPAVRKTERYPDKEVGAEPGLPITLVYAALRL